MAHFRIGDIVSWPHTFHGTKSITACDRATVLQVDGHLLTVDAGGCTRILADTVPELIERPGRNRADSSRLSANDLLESTMRLRVILTSYATDGGADEEEFRALRAELIACDEIASHFPDFLRRSRTLRDFWSFIKPKFPSYRERREYLREQFSDIETFLEAAVIREKRETPGRSFTNSGAGSDPNVSPMLNADLAHAAVGGAQLHSQLAMVQIPPEYTKLQEPVKDFFLDRDRRCESYERNVFIMTRFSKSNTVLSSIDAAIRDTLSRHGLFGHRADDRCYPPDRNLWDNVCTYMICCSFGVAVLEDVVEKEFNPNVALEYGFMRALGKRVLLLKERQFAARSDILGTLWEEFDSYAISDTVPLAISRWLRDVGITMPVAPADTMTRSGGFR